MKSLNYILSNNFLFTLNPYNLRYQIPRALIALSQLINLIFTDPAYYFNDHTKLTSQNMLPNLFGFEGGYIISIIVLVWVILGLLPQLSCVMHAYVSFSFFFGSVIIEGGDQVAQIMSMLLVPICIFDRRINLWSNKKYFKYHIPETATLFAHSCIRVAQVQIAIVYLFAGAIKANVSQWTEGSALYYWFYHSMGASDTVKSMFGWLVSSHFLSPLLNWSVLLIEFLLFAALFMNIRQKRLLFFPALIFHIGIAVVFGLWAFSITMVAGLMILITPHFLFISNHLNPESNDAVDSPFNTTIGIADADRGH